MIHPQIQRIAAADEIGSVLAGANSLESTVINRGRRVAVYFEDASQGHALYDLLAEAMQETDPHADAAA